MHINYKGFIDSIWNQEEVTETRNPYNKEAETSTMCYEA